MTDTNDLLADTLQGALLTVLLGSHAVPTTIFNSDGSTTSGVGMVESAFIQHIRTKVQKGEFDGIIQQAMDLVDPAAVARAFETMFAKLIIEGLGRESYFGGRSEPNWMQRQAKDIAVAAAKQALSDDDALMDTLREKIGMEVDRNRVGISVSLSDPET